MIEDMLPETLAQKITVLCEVNGVPTRVTFPNATFLIECVYEGEHLYGVTGKIFAVSGEEPDENYTVMMEER